MALSSQAVLARHPRFHVHLEKKPQLDKLLLSRMSDQCQVANRLPIELRHSSLGLFLVVTLKISPICREGQHSGVQAVNNMACKV